LKGVNFALDPDVDITGIIGPNGAGKSTFLSVIAGEIKPNTGTLTIMGRKLDRQQSPELLNRMGIARTFQIPRPFTGMSVEDNIVVSGLVRGSLKESRERARGLMDKLNLANYARMTPGQLNLAGRKRLELARALMTQPKLLLLDELFEGLNEVEVDWMVEILKAQVRETGFKVIIVEHVMSAVRKLAQKLYVLDHGECIAEGGTEEVLSSQRVIEAYLGKQPV